MSIIMVKKKYFPHETAVINQSSVIGDGTKIWYSLYND